MWDKRFDWLPITILVVFVVNFSVVYIIAVSLQHVHPFLPYISDAGSRPPESGIFGVLLNAGAGLLLCTLYLRYRHIMHHVPNYCVWTRRATYLAVFCGLVSSLGLSMVGCFPARPETMSVHLIGAMFAFIIGTVFITIDAFITWIMRRHRFCAHASKALLVVRFILCGMCVASYISVTVSARFAKALGGSNETIPIVFSEAQLYSEEVMAGPPPAPSTPRLVSAISEWILAASLLSYFTTLVTELRVFSLTKPEPLLLHTRGSAAAM